MLFEPFTFSGLTVKNRIVRAALYEKRADADGFVTDALIRFYEDLARGGSGLIITGSTLVHPSGRSLPRMLSVHSDIYIEGLKRLTDAVHGHDCLIALELTHGGAQCPPVLLGGGAPYGPSDFHNPFTKAEALPLSNETIWELIDAFGEGARRAETAGFDAVEIHASNGYLISGFLSPHTNRRDDYWGGDEERRFHFLEEVSKAVRAEVGGDYPVLVKLNAEDLCAGGLMPDEGLRVALRLEAMGTDAVELSAGLRPFRVARPPAMGLRAPTIGVRPETEVYLREASRLFKKGLRIPVILTGGLRSRAVMEDVLMAGDADLIGLGRPLLREPGLPSLLIEGRGKAECVSCNSCMRFNKLPRIECARAKTQT